MSLNELFQLKTNFYFELGVRPHLHAIFFTFFNVTVRKESAAVEQPVTNLTASDEKSFEV
jgi:hypothetical protein